MKRDGSEGGSGEPVDSIAVILVENDSDTQLQFAELHYFAISRSAKAEYCDTFPDENGRTCRNVGAITAWTKKRENDDVFQT